MVHVVRRESVINTLFGVVTTDVITSLPGRSLIMAYRLGMSRLSFSDGVQLKEGNGEANCRRILIASRPQSEKSLERFIKRISCMDSLTRFELFINSGVVKNQEFKSLTQEMLEVLPQGIHVDQDCWNLLEWETRKTATSMNVHFDKYKNKELMQIVKSVILHKRAATGYTGRSAKTENSHILWLDKVLGSRPLQSIKTSDFYEAETLIANHYSHNTASRMSITLKSFGSDLNRLIGTRIDYNPTLKSRYSHGKNASDEEKESKLIPDTVIRDLLAFRNESRLSTKDDFFISVFCILSATGLRINELTTLPKDCINKIDEERIQILHYPEKGGPVVPRPIAPELKDMVLDSYDRIIELTELGRKAAKELMNKQLFNWSKIFVNDEALKYFTEKWCHDWTSRPENNMLNPEVVWDEPGKRFIDVLSELAKHNNHKIDTGKALGIERSRVTKLAKIQRAAIAGDYKAVNYTKSNGKKRTNWDTDSRAISTQNYGKDIHNSNIFKKGKADKVAAILDEALHFQLQGKVYPSPKFNERLEKKYVRRIEPLVSDNEGNPLLHLHDALFVLPKYYLTDSRETNFADVNIVRDRQFAIWLRGEKRSKGTRNHEDSVFSRLNIIDERTDKPVEMTSHDIRHWLNTMYQQGGLSQDQIALIFNRKYKAQNATYDQTSNKKRQQRMRDAIKENKALGRISETFTRLAKIDREEAEEYLEATTRMINPMPHGMCLLDWSSTPCPHNLSCFDCESHKPSLCEHLVVDKTVEVHLSEIKRLGKESESVINAMELQGLEGSPQLQHHMRVKHNIESLLKLMSEENAKK